MCLVIVIILSIASSALVFDVKSQASSSYYYTFNVDGDGFTNVEINFSSTSQTGSSWVFIPKYQNWTHTLSSGAITQSQIVATNQVSGFSDDLYFYQAFKFSYQSAHGSFNMTIRYDFENGALIIEPRGIFYSPYVGFQANSDGQAEVFFPSSFDVNPNLAAVIGSTRSYSVTSAESSHVFTDLPENVVRIQVEFSTQLTTPSITSLKSADNHTFTFNSVTRYNDYARTILAFYDRIYSNYTALFNVTLDDVVLQWFLPDFQSLLAVGGYVPVVAGESLGEININIVFIRAVNGTTEVIAAHELVHRFLGKAGISPNDFLWFHEGMAQYESLRITLAMGYPGATQERDNLEQGSTALIGLLGGQNFGFLQAWTPSQTPVNIGNYYIAAYYVVSRLEQKYGSGFYENLFKLINGSSVDNLSILALRMSEVANTSVAITLQNWGFTVADLYSFPDVRDRILEAQKAVAAVNPIFQPYKSLAQYFYDRGLASVEQGSTAQGMGLLQDSITIADWAPLLTFLTILAIVALLIVVIWIISRRKRAPVVPQARVVVQPPTV